MENWEISPPKHSARAWHIKTYMDLPYKNERNSWIGKIYQTRPKQSVFLGSKKHHLVKWVGFYHVFVKPPKNRRIAFFEVDGNALSWHVAGIAAWDCWLFRNPANQLRLVVFPFFTRFYTSLVVQDIFHQQYGCMLLLLKTFWKTYPYCWWCWWLKSCTSW